MTQPLYVGTVLQRNSDNQQGTVLNIIDCRDPRCGYAYYATVLWNDGTTSLVYPREVGVSYAVIDSETVSVSS